jgi:hypothetical protein
MMTSLYGQYSAVLDEERKNNNNTSSDRHEKSAKALLLALVSTALVVLRFRTKTRNIKKG